MYAIGSVLGPVDTVSHCNGTVSSAPAAPDADRVVCRSLARSFPGALPRSLYRFLMIPSNHLPLQLFNFQCGSLYETGEGQLDAILRHKKRPLQKRHEATVYLRYPTIFPSPVPLQERPTGIRASSVFWLLRSRRMGPPLLAVPPSQGFPNDRLTP